MEKPAETQELKHIVRIANIDLPGDKALRIALTHIRGIGINLADAVCKLAKVPKATKTGALNAQQVETLSKIIASPVQNGLPVWMVNHRREFESNEDRHLVLGSLTFVQDNDIKRQKKIKSYIGVRHIRGLPVRGQRTRSNFRKSKGKVVGVVKKKEAPSTKTAEAPAPKGKK